MRKGFDFLNSNLFFHRNIIGDVQNNLSKGDNFISPKNRYFVAIDPHFFFFYIIAFLKLKSMVF